MTDASSFTKLVPGFDFLQGLVKNAGTIPHMGQWVAPTLNPEELEKRISELRTVQFWLEQNARMLGATIQALEVQRMTLSTLKTMNVQMDDLRESLMIRPKPTEPGQPVARPAPPAAEPEPETTSAAAKAAATEVPAGIVDPMQWWGALTKQFTELAASAVNEGAVDAAKNLASSMMKSPLDAVTPPAVGRKASAPAARKAAKPALKRTKPSPKSS